MSPLPSALGETPPASALLFVRHSVAGQSCYLLKQLNRGGGDSRAMSHLYLSTPAPTLQLSLRGATTGGTGRWGCISNTHPPSALECDPPLQRAAVPPHLGQSLSTLPCAVMLYSQLFLETWFSPTLFSSPVYGVEVRGTHSLVTRRRSCLLST